MNKNDKKIALTNIEFILIIIVGFVMGMGIMLITYPQNNKEYKKVDSNIQTIIDTYNNILKNYYTDVTPSIITNGAIKGMLSAVEDPYTTFMDEATTDRFNIIINGAYRGIGVEITNIGDELVILGVLGDSPAKEAGLKAGDIIKSVNGKDFSSSSADEFSNYVKEGTEDKFNITVIRDGEEKTFEIKKSSIILKSVASDVIEYSNKKIGYLYISVFAMNTYEQFSKELASLEKQGIDSLIIDLRENSGGELGIATKMISLFVKNDKVIYQIEDRDGSVTKTYSKGKQDKKYPIVILVNESTASASEIMAAALKDDLGATIIGKNTYGKGTVQTVITASNGEKYKMTISKWLTPNGTWINGAGIKPDIEVELDSKKDTQLERAKEYIVNH